MTADILTRLSCCEKFGRPKLYRFYTRYQIMYQGRGSRKLYTFVKARKLVSRAKRMGLDCYMASMQVRLEVRT